MLSFLGSYLPCKTICDNDCFLPEKLMIKEFCTLIGQEHLLVNTWKLCGLNCRKNTFFPLSCWLFFILIIFNLVVVGDHQRHS